MGNEVLKGGVVAERYWPNEDGKFAREKVGYQEDIERM